MRGPPDRGGGAAPGGVGAAGVDLVHRHRGLAAGARDAQGFAGPIAGHGQQRARHLAQLRRVVDDGHAQIGAWAQSVQQQAVQWAGRWWSRELVADWVASRPTLDAEFDDARRTRELQGYLRAQPAGTGRRSMPCRRRAALTLVVVVCSATATSSTVIPPLSRYSSFSWAPAGEAARLS